MDLSALGSTLPPGLADAERDMGDKFRASALSITNLYKSSLAYTKQAYHVGYAACLADVLSTVQSSIAGGQDASQTLSRLMDWAEARETAMAAFAAEETDEPNHNQTTTTHSAPVPLRRAAITKQALTHLRPASAPLPDHSVTLLDHQYANNSSPVSPDLKSGNRNSITSTLDTPSPPSGHYTFSSPTTASSSSSVPRPPIFNVHSTKIHHSPVRSSHRSASETAVTQSTFNPTLPQLPTAGMPFTSTTKAGGVEVMVGSKRTLVDFEMGEEHTIPSQTRSTPNRATKRRSMGLGFKGNEDGEGEKRRGRRGGHGNNGGQGVI